jgi:DNA-binding NarL/FixJ family response regulator
MDESGGERTAVLLDEHPIWLDGLERILTGLNLQTVAKVSTRTEATAAVSYHRPDLLVLDPSGKHGEADCLAWVRQVRQQLPEMKIVVLASADDRPSIAAAFAAGANAYVVKRASPDDLATAIRQAFESSIFLRPPVESWLTAGTPSTFNDGGLTRREREILTLVADGRTNAQAAHLIWVTEQTVKFHLANVYKKLGVANRTEASRWAQMNGLLTRNASKDPEESPALAVSA